MKGTALSLNNVLNRQILPVLNACADCGKLAKDHGKEKHEYKRVAGRPEGRGWHAFRRRFATNLHALGVSDKTIPGHPEDANVAVTQSYIKTLDSQSIAAMRQLESLGDAKLISAGAEHQL